jgi:nucleotide-binding universal stress UspA family protein
VIYEYPEYAPEELYHLDRDVAEQQAQQLVGDLASWAGREVEGIDVHPVAVNDRRPARALIERAEGADLLVVGSRGRGGFSGLVLGSVGQQCAHHTPCPLTIVP